MERRYFEINEQSAKMAHDMMSFRDYVDGSTTADYKRLADKMYDLAEKVIEARPKCSEKVERLAVTYARRMAANYNNASRIGCMCPSIMITGGSNFPVRKKEKQNAASGRNMQEFRYLNEYYENKLHSILMGANIISSSDEDAIEQLEEKLSNLEAKQEFMKSANAYYRKHKTIEGFPGFSAKLIERLREEKLLEEKPFDTWQLSNNNANIKRVKERIASLKKIKERETKEYRVDELNLVIKENVEDMRIQLFFDGKPDTDVRDILKHNAFKWAPSNGCWQRQLTDNARYAVKTMLPKLKELVSCQK